MTVARIDIALCRIPLETPVQLGPATIERRDYVALRLQLADGSAGYAYGYDRGMPLFEMAVQAARGYLGQHGEVRNGLRASVLGATPAPRPTTSPRPTPTPSARPAPRPSRTSQGGSQRFEDAFREGSPSPRATGTTDSQPARTFGAAERASLAQAVNRQLRPHWNAPQGVDVEKLVTVVTWDLNPDGSLKGRPRVVRTTGVTDSNRPQVDLYGERAVRAVQLAAPFDLPEEYYEHWDRLTWEFDRNLSR